MMDKPIWFEDEGEETSEEEAPELSLVPAPKGVGFSTSSGTPTRTEEEISQMKAKFAYQFLAKDGDGFSAALTVTSNTLEALQMSDSWPMDQEVKSIIDRLVEEYPPEHFLPTKVELCRKVWSKLECDDLEVSDFVRLSHHYAELRAFFPDKKSNGVQNNIVIQNKVMKVVDHGTTDQWAEALSANQIKLQSDLDGL